MANEKRLIDANALLEAIRFEYDLNYGEILINPCNFADMVDDASTVNAVEVVHGRWIDKKLDNFRMWEVRCSECDWAGISNYDAYNEPYDFNYCPNCGAKMDGGGQNG